MRLRRLMTPEINLHPTDYRPDIIFPNERRHQLINFYNGSETFITEIGERAFTNYFLEIIVGTEYLLKHQGN